MARTPEGEALTRIHRQRQLAVRATALSELSRMWRGVDPTDLSMTMPTFVAASSVAVQARHEQSHQVAARYFRQFRTVEQVAGRTPDIEPVVRLADDVVQAQVRGAALSGVVNARRRGFSPSAAARNALVKVSGSVTSLVFDGARQALMSAVGRDDQAEGWQRVTAADPCEFCLMRAMCGPVFSASTVEFEAHTHCACMAEPVYQGSSPPPTVQRLRDDWERVSDGLSETEAAKAWRRQAA